jgi:4-amino-4-deoxy-L-arabinose transferase-like glycosyltransferase
VKRAQGSGLRALPAWGWLAGIIAASFALRAWLARDMVAPFIMVDELIYAELARSIAEEGDLLVRGVPASGYSVVYPLLISPAYLFFDGLVGAYGAVKTINALVMSLAAVPAYLLARRVLGTGLSLVAAVFSVALPSLVYTGTVMTENAFYPVFLTACLLLLLVLERPTRGRQLALLAALGVAYATRVQAVALVPAVLTAPVLLGLLRGGVVRTVRPFVPLYAVLVGGSILVLGAQLARGRSLYDLFGAYAAVGDRSYDAAEILRYLLYHWAELDLYLGIVPVAATIVLVGVARSLDEPAQAVLAVLLAASFWLVLVVAVFASANAFRIQERNVFVVAPLFLVALLVWADRGAPRPRALAIGAAAASALATLAIPFERYIDTSAISDTLMLLPWWSVQDTTGIEWVAEIVFALAVAAAAAFVLVPRRYALVLPLVVLAYYAVTFKPIWAGAHGLKQASAGALFQGIRSVPRDWIDEEVPRDAEVAVLWRGRPDRFVVNQNEFFNAAIGDVLYTSAPTPGGIGEQPVSIDEGDGVVRDRSGRGVGVPYLLSDGAFSPDGKELARDDALGTTLWRVDGPLLSTTKVEGLYPDDSWSGPEVTWTKRRCRGGALTVSLSSDPSLFTEAQTVSASAVGRSSGATDWVRFEPRETASLRIPLNRGSDTCVVRFTVSPTAVPADVIPGNTDDRVLGAHFNAFDYAPPE